MIILRFGHGLVVEVPEAECWCVCHGQDGVNRVAINGHWHACPTAHRDKQSATGQPAGSRNP